MIQVRSASFATAIVLAMLAGGCDREKPQGGQPTLTTADEAAASYVVDRSRVGQRPDIAAFTGPDDADVTLAKFAGRPLLLNLWATWCAPCIKEMPMLDSLAGRGGVTVLAVSQDLTGAEAVGPFFAERNFQHIRPYLDPENVLAAVLGANELPVTILFDAKGLEVLRVTGALDWTGDEAGKLIAEAAAPN